MNFEQLRSFQAVAAKGGFSRAAESLYLTQSTISMQVAALEKELGVRLFERLGRRVVLTHAGDVMLGYAFRILSLIDASKRAMTELRGLDAGELRVGASLTIGSYVIPEVLGEFRRSHPGVRIVLDIAPTGRIADGVVGGSLDLGMVEADVDDPELVVEPFFMDELVLIVPAHHRWAGREALPVAALAEEPFIEREPGSGTRELVRQRLAEKGVAVRPVLEMGSPEAIKSAVRAGLGVAIVSRSTVELELRAGLLSGMALDGVSMIRPFLTVMHKDKHLSPPLSALFELLSLSFRADSVQTGRV
jgi:LysR family transcriptional regulator, transcriptional activator of the cysJI operon